MLEHEADWGESIIQEYNRLMEEAGKRERGRTREETKEVSREENKTQNESSAKSKSRMT